MARPIIRIQSSTPAIPIVKAITGHSGQLVLRAHSPQSVSFVVCSSPLTSLRQGDFSGLASPVALPRASRFSGSAVSSSFTPCRASRSSASFRGRAAVTMIARLSIL